LVGTHHRTPFPGRFLLRPLQLARTPEEPQFALALLKLVIELRHDKKLPMEQAIVRALKGMRVDRECFRRWVVDHRERYERAAAGVAVTARPARFAR